MKKFLEKIFVLLVLIYLLIRACLAFQKIAWGTGLWWGEYSLKWGLAFAIFIVFSILFVVAVSILLWKPDISQPLFHRLASARERLGMFRWIPALLLFILPVWLFQYTPWGLVFNETHLRILFWGFIVIGIAFLLTKGTTLLGWNEFSLAVIITSVEFTVAQAFLKVSDYPFSMGWSEGNRMWDYSVLFGREIYNYPLEKNIPVLLDVGRQLVGGLPFLFKGLTIEMERAWIGLSVLIPYLLLGLAAFLFTRKNIHLWILTSLWVLLFLKQGPIHPPLVLCAVLVALIWRRPLWLSLPVIAVTGYLAYTSRFTWMFAPGMWIGMLELAGAGFEDKKSSRHAWIRAGLLALAGAIGGYFGPGIIRVLTSVGNFFVGTSALQAAPAASATISGVVDTVSSQPLLWYRLFPNATYGNGILVGLFVATIPLIVVLFYLVSSRKWKLNVWQSLAILLPLGAFLIVGLIASTKIGGGGDLHNMDMFLIGLMFVGVLAWRSGDSEWMEKLSEFPTAIKVCFVLMFIIPGIQPLSSLRTYEYSGDPAWLVVLTDAPSERALELLPPDEIVDYSLQTIRDEVAFAQEKGEVLFLDQRQLLTFGYIERIPFVPEYEKKVLMNEALRSNGKYFAAFYADLAAHRFALIVSEPLRTPIKDSSYQFGEENNAWVTWVSTPVLCYYEPKVNLAEVGVQLLVPKSEPVDCSDQLP
jgi:hypothetical protein